MTPEQQRIAIAQACGWKGISPEYLTGYAPWRPTPYSERVMGDLESIPLDLLPDYLNDLNAMHEAERVRICSNEQIQEYFYQLNYAVGLVSTTSPAWIKEFACYALIHATAAQRAEAFLRTLNLWKD